jgi:hypothetical protein
MENLITNTLNKASKVVSILVLVLISFTSFGQGHGGHGPGHGGPGGHGGNGGNGGGHGGGGGHHPQPCNAHFNSHRDSIVNGIQFSNAPGSGAATFAWDFGDGSTSTSSNPSHTYAAEGTYYVCLTVTDTVGGGCTSTNCDSVHVFTPAPHCNAHFFNLRDTITNGIRYFSGNNSQGATYAWDFGDGSTSSNEDPSHVYANAGTYYVCLTVSNTNAGGTCTDSYCDSVHVFTPAH